METRFIQLMFMKAGQAKMQLLIRCVELADPFMSVSCLPNLVWRAGNGSSIAETCWPLWQLNQCSIISGSD